MKKDMHRASQVLSAGAAALLAVSLAGCGSSSHDKSKDVAKAGAAKPTNAVTGSTKNNHVPKFVGVQHPLPSGKALENTPDKYKYVLQTGCSAVAGGWEATGTAQNTTGKPLPFKVLVFFTDAQARIVDAASTAVTVPAKSKGTWTASRQFKAPKGTLCVVRAVS